MLDGTNDIDPRLGGHHVERVHVRRPSVLRKNLHGPFGSCGSERGTHLHLAPAPMTQSPPVLDVRVHSLGAEPDDKFFPEPVSVQGERLFLGGAHHRLRTDGLDVYGIAALRLGASPLSLLCFVEGGY